MTRTFAVLLSLLLYILPAAASEEAAWVALRGDGHVALMRHADAPGFGDPPDWRLDDCSTQRNLSAQGRADAAAVGARLKTQGARLGRVVSSPWCRCIDTATLMDVGRVEIEPTFSNAVVLSDRRDALAPGARAIIRDWKGPGTLLVVTHGANIQALIGYNPAAGEIVVVAPQADGAPREIGRLPVPPR
ncbi:histidine phosphatase family protein [Reyranella sp. CPCC 100927]|uniref:histidine phosphatase family protein n=1 Tax=Reyranella sp. CPCC 100927 TaxID=2599616 RepID=UPI002105760B|nr:histidine phosphatase family protein [Reyranella sp. CPCC 100927]